MASVFRTEPKMLWDRLFDESHIKMLRANLVILSVTNRIANELALGISVVSRVRLRGVVVPSPEHRIRVNNPQTITTSCW